MKKNVIGFLCLILMVLGSCEKAFEQDYTQYVNPLIGTTGLNPTEYGGTIPAVLLPFGMTHWTAMTRPNKIGASAYHYNDSAIIGFIGTHQPAVWMGDYGQVSFMPQLKLKPSMDKRGISFSHSNEKANPYHYSVEMDHGIQVQFSATERCAAVEVNYPSADSSFLIIDASRGSQGDGFVQIIPEKRQVIGYNPDRHSAYLSQLRLPSFKGYFVFQFESEFASFGVYHSDTLLLPDTLRFQGKRLGAFVQFADNNQKQKFSVATSFIGFDQAFDNLKREVGHRTKESISEEGKEVWNQYLGRIEVDSEDDDFLTTFYTALYRCFSFPRIFSEYGRYYSAFDDQVHEGINYTDFSLWDTHRTLHPLLTLIAPERVNDMMQSLVNAYKEGGWLPKWPNPSYTNIMIGTHADAVLADAVVKGFDGFEVDKAYEAMLKNALQSPSGDEQCRWPDRMPNAPYEARGGLSWYKRLGYVPSDKVNESVSRTVEFSFNDYCVAQMARALGKNDDHLFFMERSKNYRHLYHPKRGMFSPRLSNGDWSADTTVVFLPRWNAYKAEGFTEGSPYTYQFGAMHDVQGMIEMMGGAEVFKNKLTKVFEENRYHHDNEPGQHYIYLFNYTGDYAVTQRLLKEHIPLNYQNAPSGLSGNEDCGQMSAWFVMSSLGFYPMPPASGIYSLGVPGARRFRIKLPKGAMLEIVRNTDEQITRILLDGRLLEKPFVPHAELIKAKKLVFTR